MYNKLTIIFAIIAVVEARFGQEQVPVAAIQALDGSFGNSGEASTLAGSVPSALLGAADPCDKLTLADQIVSTLGNSAQVISAAKGLVAAEQNFNNFETDVPAICGDASLPTTAALRGIVPKVDPAVGGADVENANSASSVKTAFDAGGLSVADIMVAQGFSNFTVDGAAVDAGGNANAGGDAAATPSAAPSATPVNSCGGTASATPSPAAGGNNNNNNNGGGSSQAVGQGAVDDPVTGTFLGFEASSLGLDFGSCVPTVKFEESLNGRAAGESTFQAVDPVVNEGQQEALNPDIIFNRICDQLTNVCGAADDAVAACDAAQAKLGGGAKDASTANKWNTELGFDGADINPDNAPKDGLVGHT